MHQYIPYTWAKNIKEKPAPNQSKLNSYTLQQDRSNSQTSHYAPQGCQPPVAADSSVRNIVFSFFLSSFSLHFCFHLSFYKLDDTFLCEKHNGIHLLPNMMITKGPKHSIVYFTHHNISPCNDLHPFNYVIPVKYWSCE